MEFIMTHINELYGECQNIAKFPIKGKDNWTLYDTVYFDRCKGLHKILKVNINFILIIRSN